MLTVAGAGMAGLVAAARARELGVECVVLEKGDRPGGSMLLSSCVVWRHHELEDFRRECPGGDPRLQRALVEELDEALDWLESLGAVPTMRETGNPLTVGRRFDPRALTATLARRVEIRLGRPLESADGPLVLATGGFGRRLATARRLGLRANPWSEGDGLDFARSRGAALTAGMDEFYGRAMPAPPARVEPADYVRAAQLYGRFAHRVDERGRPFFEGEPSWSENDLVQALARLPEGTGWYLLDADALERPMGERIARERAVADLVAVAEELGGEVRRAVDLAGLRLPDLEPSPLLARAPFTAVKVRAAVTHTIGGLATDDHGRVLDRQGSPVEGLFACGADAGGVATGGYASGLAAALVFGRRAAQAACV